MRRTHSAPGLNYSGSLEEVVSEDDEFFLAWSLIGYGLVWTRNRSCGKILSSLSVFPVVETFNGKVWDLILSGELNNFQQLLSSGAVHPFSRVPGGESLLHVS
jgi:hypothetical protein